jgi:predicted O-methyltransferase YrrM
LGYDADHDIERVVMVVHPKEWLKGVLTYESMVETQWIAALLNSVKVAGAPVCPPDAGDLIFSLIRTNGYRRCLETGFYTGSTALYMSAAVAPADGEVISIGLDGDETVRGALDLLKRAGVSNRHQLIRENSNRALPRLFLAGERFDFIYMDGWKTFDHLAFEVYLFNQLLAVGGTIVFDDAYMP